MTETPQTPRTQSWLGPVVVFLLAAQLGLTWIQGSLIHRQQKAIQGLREDVQGLAESMELGDCGIETPNDGFMPVRNRRAIRLRNRVTRVAHISLQDDSAEQATRDLDASRESAQKALKDAREAQQKLSLEENARKAEEKAKLEHVQRSGQKWIWIGLGVGLLALVLRSWLRRRG